MTRRNQYFGKIHAEKEESFFLVVNVRTQVFWTLEASIAHSFPIPLSYKLNKRKTLLINVFFLPNSILSSFFSCFKAYFLFLSPSLLISNKEIIHILCMTDTAWKVLVPTVSWGSHWTIGSYWPPSLIKTMCTYWLPNSLSHT